MDTGCSMSFEGSVSHLRDREPKVRVADFLRMSGPPEPHNVLQEGLDVRA